MTSKELREAVCYVRATFFPRWIGRTPGEFSSVPPTRRSMAGHWDGKKITVKRSLNHEEILVALIHEFAHAAVGTTGLFEHGKRWQTRMARAARRAAKIGEKELARVFQGDQGLLDILECTSYPRKAEPVLFSAFLPQQAFEGRKCIRLG